MKYTIAALSLSVLASCEKDEPYDERAPWRFYEPDISRSIPIAHGDLTWYADDSISSELLTSLKVAAEEWRLVMGCNYTPRQSILPDKTDIQFSCKETDRQRAEVTLGTDNILHVDLTQLYCETSGITFARYAWVRALGFPEAHDSDAPMTSGLDAAYYRMSGTPSEIERMELDGYRIWAKNNGAKGCGSNEIDWSWVSDPNQYRTHPNVKDVNAWLQMNYHDQQTSNILPRVP